MELRPSNRSSQIQNHRASYFSLPLSLTSSHKNSSPNCICSDPVITNSIKPQTTISTLVGLARLSVTGHRSCTTANHWSNCSWSASESTSSFTRISVNPALSAESPLSNLPGFRSPSTLIFRDLIVISNSFAIRWATTFKQPAKDANVYSTGFAASSLPPRTGGSSIVI